MNRYVVVLLPAFIFSCTCSGQKKEKRNPANEMAVIAYYSGNAAKIDSFPIEKLTHIIFSFGHLRQTRFVIDNTNDTVTIQKLVSLKSRNPALKIILSLGGWGGCEFCSPVFDSIKGRQEFAQSVKEQLIYFKADGIDLDWEYPAIEGYPGHAYKKEDKTNFTALIKTLRDTLGKGYEISFAAGGFDKFLYESVEWDKIMPMLDKVNLMSYDLVSGYSKVTGHHTPLYPAQQQKQSADNAIRYLDSIGVPLQKLIIGAAFYARVWEQVPAVNNGLYQPGVFKSFIGFNQFSKYLLAGSGFVFYRDTVAQASYAYNVNKKLFATFDDSLSIAHKTKYVLDKGLGGIMFWELSLDKTTNGLVDVIDRVRHQKN